MKMKKVVLSLAILLAFSTSAMAIDIAISTQAGWYGQAAADREMQEIVNNVKSASIQLFTASDHAALAQWVIAHTGNGQSDLLILNGQFPNTIYAPGNTQANNSLAELFLDDGNCIINTGDYMFYVVDGAGTNGEGGLRTMMDIPSISMWDDDTQVTVTADGLKYTPALRNFATDRPFHLNELANDWFAELILAQNAAGTRADPVIVKNSVTGGRLGIFYQTAGQDNDPRGEVISEWINNWYLPLVSAGTTASDPSPTDKATDIPIDTTLSWTPSKYAVARDVYFGTAFADVNAASRSNPMSVLAAQGQTDIEFSPAGLEFGQTYFWRVDEVNGAPDNTIFKGKTWSFTVEPFSYPVTPIAATASSFQAGYTPQNTINGSGLNANDEHSLTLAQMWMTGSVGPHWISYEFDKAYKLDKMWVWNSNQIIEAFVGFGARNVTVEYSQDGATWTALEGVPEFAQGTGMANYTANTTVDFGGVTAQFVKLTINSNWGGVAPQTGLSEVRFFYVPVQAFKPQPAVGAANVSVATDLNWRPGREATSHKVAIGTDSAAVAAGAGAVAVTEHSFTPVNLTLGTQYFWKVDEIGDTGTYAGDVWSFTTEAYTIVDDFESYKDSIDAQNTIWHAWIDGLTDKANGGSQVGYDQAPFAERVVVRSGGQAMPLMYDNSASAFSEAKRMFDPAQNWTAHGAKTLSVHFAGQAGNTGKLYLKINNTKVAYTGEDKDLARAGWQAWNIDLTKITGVASVRSLTIGVEGSGAKGKLYFDDVRLSPRAPEFTNPVEPGSANLIARYAFEGDVKDSSGKGRNGTANGGPTFVAGVDGQALRLDGSDDFVVVGPVGISGAAPRTISGWVKADTTTITDWTNIFGFTSSPDGVSGKSFDMNKRGGANQYCIHAYGWERNIMAIDLEWHHLAATYDGTTVAWYGDGQFVASEAWVLDTQDLVHMGKRAHAAGGNFPGSIDEVRIYNKALSADEIAWLAGRRLPVHRAQ
jgi:hypothetical protein